MGQNYDFRTTKRPIDKIASFKNKNVEKIPFFFAKIRSLSHFCWESDLEKLIPKPHNHILTIKYMKKFSREPRGLCTPTFPRPILLYPIVKQTVSSVIFSTVFDLRSHVFSSILPRGSELMTRRDLYTRLPSIPSRASSNLVKTPHRAGPDPLIRFVRGFRAATFIPRHSASVLPLSWHERRVWRLFYLYV